LEIEHTRRAEEAQSRLQAFVPAPPYGAGAAKELRAFQVETEKCRMLLEQAYRERKAHQETHAMTLSY
jgi:hypothetical protein